VAAAFPRHGAKPPETDAEVEAFMEKSIREALGGSAPGPVLGDVAELVAIKTDELLVAGFALAPGTEITETEWLTDDMSQPVSTYAGEVETELDKLLPE
jgi:hypothetical protein